MLLLHCLYIALLEAKTASKAGLKFPLVTHDHDIKSLVIN